MKQTITILMASALLAGVATGAERTTVSKLYDSQLSGVESEIVSLAEAMPAGKYNFAPSGGEFKNVRNFGSQVKHVATVIYLVCAAAAEEKPPVDLGSGENGPATATSKEQIVQYLKDSFAYAHKVMRSLDERSVLELVKSPFGNGNEARGALASTAVAHTFDHYGQMVVYARMNSIVPPASR
ncbi:MAG TPA: DinB family protein [Bryobacteraceae bacterium]|nr:DinB family protein [Bryobacteraceae bacterium]